MPLQVAVRKISTQILPSTQPNALKCGIVSGHGDHIEATPREVFGAHVPDGNPFQEFIFAEGTRNLSPRNRGKLETNLDLGVAPRILLLPPCKPPNIFEPFFLRKKCLLGHVPKFQQTSPMFDFGWILFAIETGMATHTNSVSRNSVCRHE